MVKCREWGRRRGNRRCWPPSLPHPKSPPPSLRAHITMRNPTRTGISFGCPFAGDLLLVETDDSPFAIFLFLGPSLFLTPFVSVCLSVYLACLGLLCRKEQDCEYSYPCSRTDMFEAAVSRGQLFVVVSFVVVVVFVVVVPFVRIRGCVVTYTSENGQCKIEYEDEYNYKDCCPCSRTDRFETTSFVG